MAFGIGPLELALLLLLGVGLVFALIIGILLFAFKKRPQQPGWQGTGHAPPGHAPPGHAPPGHATPGHAPPAQAPPPVGVWNAEVLPPGGFGLSGRTFGVFRLERGVLSFFTQGAQTPTWAVPCRDLAVGGRSFFALDGADVRLLGPMGEWHCSVSEEHINRFSQNTMKTLRERGYADQFIHLLRWHGAASAD